MNASPRSHPFMTPFLLAAGLLSMVASAQAEETARIVTQISKPAECLSNVAVRQINGREKFVSPQGFDLPAGSYRLAGSFAIDSRFCPTARERGTDMQSFPPLEADFEAGKTYYVGFDYSSDDRTEWAYVIWKIE